MPFEASIRQQSWDNYSFAELRPRATKVLAADFLRWVLAAIPYKVRKVLTDNGTRFGNMPHQVYAWRPLFDRVCDEHGIKHRFTKPAHPWTNGQVERFNRPLKEATVQRYHYQTTEQLNEPASLFTRLHPRQTPQAPAGQNTPRSYLPTVAPESTYPLFKTPPSSPWDYIPSPALLSVRWPRFLLRGCEAVAQDKAAVGGRPRVGRAAQSRWLVIRGRGRPLDCDQRQK